MPIMQIHSALRDYTVHFTSDADFVNRFDRFPERIFVVDENVWLHHRQGCLQGLNAEEVVVFDAGEDRKTLDGVTALYDRLMERAAKKNLTMISIGGGILQDLTGFVASTLYRGIHWVFVPTTLLAQADSCIGSKTSLNYKRFKNLIGTFYPPAEVHVHTPFLRTLEDIHFMSGLGEVVKLHLMGGKKAVGILVEAIPRIIARENGALITAIRDSLRIKYSYMADDEFDTGRRNFLNYGHCFGHPLESVSNYSVPHGQAVVAGMLFANIAAERRGLLMPETALYLSEALLLKTLTAPLHRKFFDLASLLEAMKKDKKRIGDGLVVVMMDESFNFIKMTDFTSAELEAATERLMALVSLQN